MGREVAAAQLRRRRRGEQHGDPNDQQQQLPAEQRRRYFAWIESAKREDTKLRRLKEALRLLARGKVLGLK